MRYFLDTEFDEDGVTIELISIGIVAEDGRELYCVSNEFDPEHCDDWVKQNVLPQLPPKETWISRADIRDQIEEFLDFDPRPEFWAYFGAYDWVVFARLWGKLVHAPGNFPRFCRDIRQLMDQHSLSKRELPRQVSRKHDALADAWWVKVAYDFIAEKAMRGGFRPGLVKPDPPPRYDEVFQAGTKMLNGESCFCGGGGTYQDYNCGEQFTVTCPHCVGTGIKRCKCATSSVKCGG